MTALMQIPHRDRLRAAILKRDGMGWRVGIGWMATGEIDDHRGAYLQERPAERAALALADEGDLIAVRC